MITPEEVCVDAGVAIKVVTEESDFELADALFEQWANHDVQIIAPLFFEVEVDSILSQKIVLRRELTAEQGEIVFQRVLRLDVKRIIVPGQRERAWEIARVFNFP